jgi:hypothetical protein
MLVLAMEFSRGTWPRCRPSTGESVVHSERSARSTNHWGADFTERVPTSTQARRHSLKTEQRGPTILAAPHGRPMVYDREMLWIAE